MTSEYLVNADDLQIKMAQGAKPGEGGQLPGHKVYPWIAKTRHSTPGVGLISPPPHHDIYSIEDLAQLIHDLKNVQPGGARAREARGRGRRRHGRGGCVQGARRRGADLRPRRRHRRLARSPRSSTRAPRGSSAWRRPSRRCCSTACATASCVQVDGQLKTGRDVVIAALLGAEEYGFATAPLVVLRLRDDARLPPRHLPGRASPPRTPSCASGSRGKPEFVVNFFEFIAEEMREHLAALGFRTLEEVIGHVETCCDTAAGRGALEGERASTWRRSCHRAGPPGGAPPRPTVEQDHGLGQARWTTTRLAGFAEALARRWARR